MKRMSLVMLVAGAAAFPSQAQPATPDAAVAVAETGGASSGEVLTLEQAIDFALKHNELLAQNQEAVRKAKAQVREAKAGGLPQVTVSGQYLYQKSVAIPAGALGPEEVTITPRLSKAGNAGLTQVLDVFGLVRRARKVASLGEQVQQLNVARSKSEIIYQTRSAYYNVLRAWGAVDVAKASLKAAEEQLRQAQAFEKSGAAPKFDVTRADVQVAARRQSLISAEDALGVAGAALNAVLGRDVSTPVTIAQIEGLPDRSVDIEAQTEMAYEARPELVQLDLGVKVSKELEGIYRRSNLPTFALSSSYSYNFSGGGFSSDKGSWNAGVVASWPLLDGGAARAKTDQARSDAKSTELQKTQIKRSIALQVRTAGMAVQEAADRYEVAVKAVGQAEEALRLSRSRYENGVATQLEVIDSEAALMAARYNRNSALYDYFAARADFDAAVTGRLM